MGLWEAHRPLALRPRGLRAERVLIGLRPKVLIIILVRDVDASSTTRRRVVSVQFLLRTVGLAGLGQAWRPRGLMRFIPWCTRCGASTRRNASVTYPSDLSCRAGMPPGVGLGGLFRKVNVSAFERRGGVSPATSPLLRVP